MRDLLKEFVDQHRPEMDTAEPSNQLWNKIEMQMTFARAIAAKTFPWLKTFFFGASAVTIAAVSYLNRPGNDTPVARSYTSVPAIQQTIATSPTAMNSPVNTSPANFSLAPLPADLPGTNTASLFPEDPNTYFTGLTTVSEIADTLSNQEDVVVKQFYKGTSSLEMSGDSLSVDTLFNGVTRLELSGGSYDVDVKAHANENVNVKGKLSIKTKGMVTNKPHYKLTFTRQDTVLKINVDCEGENGSKSYMIVGSLTCEAKLNIEVPEKINLIVQDKYGDATVTGLRGGICEVKVSSGDVTLKDIQANPKLISAYGDITATNIKGNLSAKMSSGDFNLTDLTGNVDVTSSYGDQKLSNVTGTLKLSGATGHIKLINVTGDADVKTSYGDIRLENYKGTPQFTTATGDISGKNVELTGNTTLNTSYGDISLVLVNDLDALSFDLSTSYGDIRIDKNGQKYSEEKHLSIQKGNILIKAKSATGSQTYK